jgi:hypothetical protein
MSQRSQQAAWDERLTVLRPGRLLGCQTLLWLIGWNPLVAVAAAQLPNQSFEVVPMVARATVGDTIPLRFHVRLDPQDLLFDTVPRAAQLQDGVRLLSVETLRRQADRSYAGRALIAFFRPGRQAVPVFRLPFMRGVKGLQQGTLASDSAFIEVFPVAPPGNPTLRDIRELEPHGLPPWLPLGGGALAIAALITAGLTRRRSPALQPARTVRPMPRRPSPYDTAIARLDAIEREDWIDRGDIPRYVVAVTDTLRQYLEEAHAIPGLTRTSSELTRALSSFPMAAESLKQFGALLDQADLVKFARARPQPPRARWFELQARELLEDWRPGLAGLADEVGQAIPEG